MAHLALEQDLSPQRWAGPGDTTYEFATEQNLASPEQRDLLAYWQSKRQGRLAPARAEINPKEIPSLLRNLHLYEVKEDGQVFRLRLVGTELVAAVGADPTGKVITRETREPAYFERVFSCLQEGLAHRRPIRQTAVRTLAPRRDYTSAESLILPLSDDGRTVNMILVSTLFKDPEHTRD